MKKALLVFSKPPYPLYDGAAIGEYQIIEFLHDMGYNIDVVYISEKDDLETVKSGIGHFVNTIYHKILSKKESYFNVIKGLLTNRKPLQVNYFFSKKLYKYIEKIQGNYDLIYNSNIRTTEYTKMLPNEHKVFDYVDALSANYEAAKRKSSGLWHIIYSLEASRCAKYEKEVFPYYSKRRIVSDADKHHVMASIGCNEKDITVIGNYTEISHKQRIEPDNHNIVFVGVMSYEPNVHATSYFAREVFPSILDKIPDAKFYIVGKRPNREVQKLASDKVVVTGFVKDPNVYLDNAAIVVTPMLSGSGLQNKIIQAMAQGICVVTTPIGFEGMPKDEGQPIVCSSTEDMANHIIQLLRDKHARELYGSRSVTYIEKYYSKSVVYNKFKSFIEKGWCKRQ